MIADSKFASFVLLCLGSASTVWSSNSSRHQPFGSPTLEKRAPTVASSRVVGIAAAAGLTRDSCQSVRFGNRLLWTCRDTNPVTNGVPTLPIISTTAAWSAYSGPGVAPGLTQSGPFSQPFYPYASGECNDNTAGACSDGTRWTVWEDSAVLRTLEFPNGDVGGYTWVDHAHIKSDFTVLNSPTPASLYRVSYQPDRDGSGLPLVEVVKHGFYSGTDIHFGVYGGVISGTTAYLYGKLANGGIALAKVSTGGIENISNYQYWVNGAWTSTKPNINSNIAVANAGTGGQGTFFFSNYFNAYTWIGGSQFPGASMYISTAPAPEGPWTTPSNFLNPKGGVGPFGAYSIQAHPDLSSTDGKTVFVSFTNITTAGDASGTLYETPVIQVVWA
ncbi:hypothetical protein BT69DRAFT_1277159 [Atractiella rhizophila]|nr:hypothetical protein BT69DRAFT_1277159 [Atractiella rhizophila]